MTDLKKQIDLNKLPQHVAIIMDGNGRWAKARNMVRLLGHHQGIKSVREITECCTELGIKNLTLYTFSTENWNRPQDEVFGLMSLLIQTLKSELETLLKNNVRLITIGDISKLPDGTRQALEDAVYNTRNNSRMNLILALNYSSRNEITNTVNKIVDQVLKGTITAPITEEHIISNLYTAGLPDPELLIRTSGEHRLSNFLLWQTAYTEFYFTDVLWPEFKSEHLFKAIIDFQSRERRFGLTTEQLNN
ncbi:MAG: isoprenyl transferase [Saprospiraceae bacterium]